MSEAEFTKLYKYFDKRFGEIDKELAKIHDENDKTLNAVEAYAKRAETFMQEMLALAHKVDRLEQWILKVA
jgi:phage host-nuclease inhibitor protein Gam